MKRWGIKLLHDRARSVGIRVKIMGIVLSTVLCLGLSVTAIARSALRKALFRELDEKGMMLARDLATHTADFILTDDVYLIHRLISDMRLNNGNVEYILVLNRQGVPIDHTLSNSPSASLIAANPVRSPATSHTARFLTTAGMIHDVGAAILDGRAGTVRLGMSEGEAQMAIAQATHRLLLATLLASLAGVTLAALLTGVLVQPIRELVEVARAVSQGDYGKSAAVYANDEIGQLAHDFNSMTLSLQRSRDELQRKEEVRTQLLQQVITAQEEERKRIARLLHDEASQSLTSLMVGLKVLESTYPDGASSDGGSKARDQMDQLRSLLARTLDEIHGIAKELRPSAFDDLGLKEALRRLAQEDSERFGFIVDFHSEDCDNPPLPHQTETLIYRIVQEALANVARHADARNVSVLVETRESSLLVIVEDDGRGFDAGEKLSARCHYGSLGLFGMMERAALIGGRLTVESRENEGTTIFLEVPFPEGA